jgi:MGT family glycosyltransferase
MARILFATVPIVGHVYPFLGVARALSQRGHELRWYTGAKFRDDVQRTGACHEPYVSARDFDDHHMELAFPERARHAGWQQLKFDLKHIFADQALTQLADIEAMSRYFCPDLIVADPLMLGSLLFKEKSGTPLVSINVVACPVRSRDSAPFGLGILPSQRWYAPLRNRALGILVDQVLFRDVQSHWVHVRRRAGLRTSRLLFQAALDATLLVQPTVPGFEYPRSDLPANVEFVGALFPELSPDIVTSAPWLHESPGTPLVHVTQGTMSNARPDLIAPTLAGLADEPMLVVVATGGRTADELGLQRVPANARIVPYVSYRDMLPRTSVMVTNGGYGGVQLALSYGVPLVVWGSSEDKPEVAARVVWSGTGVRLSRFRPPSADEVRTAVFELLDEPGYRTRARALADEYARTDAIARVVFLIERLL